MRHAEPSPLSLDLARWFSNLRRAMVAVLAAVVALSHGWLGLRVDLRLAVPPVVALAALELARASRRKPAPTSERTTAALAAFDILCIALVLAGSGGPANPFSAVLVAYVALAASLLSARLAFGLASLSAVTFGGLFLMPSDPTCHTPGGDFSQHLYGMWVAFAVVAAIVALFLTRVRGALSARQAEIERLRREQAETAKFAALGTLAAGTAHELGTPLSTIGVLAEQLRRVEDARESAAAIGAEVERCKAVLMRMRPGARPETASLGARLAEVVPAAVAAWRRANPGARVELSAIPDRTVPMADRDVEAALGVLLDNAHAASGGAGAIAVSVSERDGAPCIVVEDDGAGLSEEAEHRAGEPFFTTKPQGEGMGLGLYLVRTLFEAAGGRVSIEPRAPRGARVSLDFAPVVAS